MQSTRDSKESEPLPAARRQTLSLLDLAPAEGCLAAALLRTPVVSYTAFSTLPLRAVFFLWPDLAGSSEESPSRVLPGSLLCGARTFLREFYPRDPQVNLATLS